MCSGFDNHDPNLVHIKITSITLTHRHHDLELRSWILSPFIIDN